MSIVKKKSVKKKDGGTGRKGDREKRRWGIGGLGNCRILNKEKGL